MTLGKGGGLLVTLLPEQRPRWQTIALLATFIAAAALLWHSDSEVPMPTQDSELRGDSEPDSFVVDALYTSYDEQGTIKIQFVSPRIEQFEANGYAIMAEPQATIQGEPGSEPWQLTAKHGKLLDGNSQLELEGDVRIVRQIGERSATLSTTRLTLDNRTNMAYTDAPVEIVDATGTTNATGMKAWLNERILELDSQVEGRYETGN
ncbi:LPS export ABC transporter periplasmic protein LptC [Marinobacter sp. M3C]|jgi:lipopolysaccharide export system protein LptC|uniref:LPS export ABC transporter periplasmic protein LptC n=1 Tax=unclassified Marinobacter TaxID=83889 RepID=UPI00200E1B07|nr:MULTISPECIES: LPS export ABC transporter periplasmic protein LptC [unclassified Marinobacter]MCL1479534.1 LPS export ABC transporter periplasmic protein LptC [Marinobacter sp.]MCL1482603.1 LPS export ABC transporter periplasmic protein LptC [Marinobacter sp.]MCL1485528.1 LPS export ABC transporter periplasmic protein LptC [Marinobacter sp.]MCL1489076.1 LPS export ABC transporter periplasmic protein LptC [Marinobacter sp.]UQG54669.1 LPS export ABC transporter periplasmic protein LptC [Marino